MCVCTRMSVFREKEKAVQREMQVGTLLTTKDRQMEELKEVGVALQVYPVHTH